MSQKILNLYRKGINQRTELGFEVMQSHCSKAMLYSVFL